MIRAALAVIAGGLVGGVIGGAIGIFVGGNFTPEFELAGLRGYEATFWLGTLVGSVAFGSSLLVYVARRSH